MDMMISYSKKKTKLSTEYSLQSENLGCQQPRNKNFQTIEI